MGSFKLKQRYTLGREPKLTVSVAHCRCNPNEHVLLVFVSARSAPAWPGLDEQYLFNAYPRLRVSRIRYVIAIDARTIGLDATIGQTPPSSHDQDEDCTDVKARDASQSVRDGNLGWMKRG